MAWIDALGVTPARLDGVRSAVEARGVRLCPRARADGHTHGVVLFEGPSAEAAERIERLTSDGRARIVAVSLDPLPGPDSWELLRAGAADAITWRDPAAAAAHVADRLNRWQAVDELLACRHVREFLVGDSRVWRSTLRDAVEVARFTPAGVLITGESGTGKERLAELIHELDPRPDKKKLVVLDCSTIVPSLSGSEFFGHERGAFTGASAAREGAFELANGGTLFLDEVGELPVALQAELLRVVQEGTFKRVGSNMWRTSSFRLVCATNRDLAAERAGGTFRSDFYYRIAGCTVHLPSLAERLDDVIPLFVHFFRQALPGAGATDLDDVVRELLVTRRYPGNVRDLRSLAMRIAHRHLGGGLITVGDVPEDEWPGPDRSRSEPDG